MRRTVLRITSLITAWLCLISASSCEKREKENGAIRALYEKYKAGEISECTLDGKTVYTGMINAHDAETRIYDATGKEIGACFYSTGALDPACEKLRGCEAVYRCEGHISGQPFTDRYGLSK